jgi:hypothetical protein
MRTSLSLSLLGLLLWTGCDFSKAMTATEGPVDSVPSLPDPDFTPVPLPAYINFGQWQVIRVVDEGKVDSNDSTPPPGCDKTRLLAIDRYGIYNISPCFAVDGTAPHSGQVPADILQRLIHLGDDLTRGDPSTPQTCQQLTDLGRIRVDLSFVGDYAARVYEVRRDQPLACSRGGDASAHALAAEIRRFLATVK